jgi:hypothetical protein
MADTSWLGRAGAVAEVDTITIAGTWAQNDTATITINGKDMVITIGTLTTTAQVATTIKEAYEGETLTDTSASVIPSGGKSDFTEHSELTATVSSSVVTLTANDAGTPWNVNSGMAVTENTAGDGTATLANATAATGPNHYDNVDNWSGGAVPTTEDVWVENSAVSILYGLSQAGNTLASFNQAASYTGDIGLPKTNASGYPEFRLDYLAVDVTALRIGYGQGTGAGRVKINSGTILSGVTVESTGSPAEVGLGAFIWKGTNVGNTLNVQNGNVSVAPFDGETAALSGAVTIAQGTTEFGKGVTFQGGSSITAESANVTARSNLVTLTNATGVVTVEETATVGTMTIDTPATVIYKSSGTVIAANINGTLDCSQDNRARTITTGTIGRGGRVIDPLQTITYGTLALASDVREVTAS